jgi:hypothetical protein
LWLNLYEFAAFLAGEKHTKNLLSTTAKTLTTKAKALARAETLAMTRTF